MGKTADDLVGFKYPAGGGNDIGVYKQPQPNTNDAGGVHSDGERMNNFKMSVGNVTTSYDKENPYGKKEMRGYGAATKGRKISGKQG